MRGAMIVVAGLAACGPAAVEGPDDGVEHAVIVDHDGVERTLRDGFAFQYDDSTWSVVLTDFDDACERLTWWGFQEAELSALFLEGQSSDALFSEAIANTRAIWADEMGSSAPFTVWIDVAKHAAGPDTPVELPGADTTSAWSDAVFWATAEVTGAPAFEQDLGARTWGPESGYEADSLGGTGSFTFSDGGATGTLATRFRTDALAQFDLETDFEVEACPSYEDALIAMHEAWTR